MNDYLAELINQSESGNEVAQIKLFFKQYYDYDDVHAAAMTCDKWMENNLFLKGVWIYYCFIKPGYVRQYSDESYNTYDSEKIFKQLITREDEICYYAYNMIALGLKTDDPLRIQYYKIAAEHGIEYAHVNLAENTNHLPSIICHFELAAAKHNRYALLQLAQIYLTVRAHEDVPRACQYYQTAMNCGYNLGYIDIVLKLKRESFDLTLQLLEYEVNRGNKDAILALVDIYINDRLHKCPQSAIKYYQLAMNCGYDLGDISTILKLRMHNIYTSVQLLEYSANRGDDKAVLALANIYATEDRVLDSKRALYLYTQAKYVDERNRETIWNIIKTGKIDWSVPYHNIWPRLEMEMIQKYGFGSRRTVLNISFHHQVFSLLLVVKFKNLSRFSFTKLIYKNVVLGIINQLAKSWITRAVSNEQWVSFL